MKEQKYHLYLSDDEYRQTIQSLVRLKNNLISQGRYTDAVDDVLFKVLKTKRACTRNNHILWLGKRRHNRPYRYRWKVRKRKCLHHRGQFVRHVQNQNISGWKFSYLRIRHSGILKKMAARLSSHQVHYSWEILYRNVSVCRYTAPPLSCVLSLWMKGLCTDSWLWIFVQNIVYIIFCRIIKICWQLFKEFFLIVW